MIFSAFERFRGVVLAPHGVGAVVVPEEQRGDYESGVAVFGGERWRVRTGRITASKPGAFVAVWRRGEGGVTEPFPDDDGVDGLLVFVEFAGRFGVFRFTVEHLRELGVVSSHGGGGKRGFRVYPAWCEGLNAQAGRSQRAQAKAFSELVG
ncbi:MepB family protein [Jonesia quinghaiensis]|uniref:MepB family protein n=1 Tax=Jonesia quinghaiensis TaxID=262806 RepID=UPI00040B4D04|nr:MepB family protein [Jonesia quinghaiensis]